MRVGGTESEAAGKTMRVFLPMDAEGQPRLEEPQKTARSGAEKRRHTRHRYTHSIEVRIENPRGRYDLMDAMTFEVSEGGISAATPNILLVGERVELYPVVGYRVHAVVRRKNGAMYGFEFVGLTEEQSAKIRAKCESLPLFTSMLDV
jgi:hypothetical protein